MEVGLFTNFHCQIWKFDLTTGLNPEGCNVIKNMSVQFSTPISKERYEYLIAEWRVPLQPQGNQGVKRVLTGGTAVSEPFLG